MTAPYPVVITGLGPISAIGIGREDFCAGLAEGREGRRAPQRLAGPWPNLPRLAECLDFAVEDTLESEKTYLDRCSELVLAACALALEDAGLQWRALDHDAVGLAVGTAFGCLDSMHNVTARVQGKGLRFASPMIFTHSFANSPASLAAIEYQVRGPVSTVCSGGTSAAGALQYALDLLRWGRARIMLAGGADALSEPLLAALNSHPDLWPEGVPAEGACLLVLETLQDARDRGANILAELAGVALSAGDDPQATEAVAHALADAQMEAGAVRFVPPPTYGHPFGARLALDVAAAICTPPDDAGSARVLTACDPGGRAAAVVVRRWH